MTQPHTDHHGSHTQRFSHARAITGNPAGTRVIDDGRATRLIARCLSWATVPIAVFCGLWNGLVISVILPAIRDGQYGLLLFMTPFLVFGLVSIYAVLFVLVGRVEVTLTIDEARVFTGIGPFGRTRRFQPSKVAGIREQHQLSSGKGGSTTSIVIEASEDVRLGGSLTAARRQWLLSELTARLL